MSSYDAACLERETLSGAWILFRNFDPHFFNLSEHCVAIICCAKRDTATLLLNASPPDARWDCGFISGHSLRAHFQNVVLLDGEKLRPGLGG